MRSIRIVILVILLLGLFSYISRPGAVYAQGSVNESVKIFVGYDSLLIRLGLRNSADLYNSLSSLLGGFGGGLKSFKLSFIKNSDWKNTYNYFLDGLWYNGTGLLYVPGSKALLVLTPSSTSMDVDAVAKDFSNRLMLAFMRYQVDNGSYIYLSPYSDIVYKSKLLGFIDNLGYAVAKWTPVTRMTDFDYYNITLLADVDNGVADLFISFINRNPGGFKNLLGQIDWEPYPNDTNTVDFTIYSRYIMLSKIPSIYNVSLSDSKTRFMIISGSTSPGSKLNPLDIELRLDYPLIVVTRDFNSTDFSAGGVYEVYLKIENVGKVSVGKVVVKEYPWWDQPGVSLVSGVVEGNVTDLKGGQSRIIKYVVRIENLSQDIYIGSAKAIVKLSNNQSLTYFSQTQYIHSNGGFIDLTMDIPNAKAELGKPFNYKLVVKNRGSVSVDNLIVGEYVIGSLAPGEERIVESSVNVESPLDIILPVFGKATYMIGSMNFNITSPETYVAYTPNKIYWPSVKLDEQHYINNSLLNVTVSIENAGLVDATDVSVKANLESIISDIKYSGGDYSLNDSSIIVHGFALGVGAKKSFSAIFNVTSSKPFLYPIFVVNVMTPSYSYSIETGVDIYYNNSVIVKLSSSGGKMITKFPYYINVSLSNNGDYSIFNYTVSADSFSEALNVTYAGNNVSIVYGGDSKTVDIVVRSTEEGNYSINGVKASFIYGGILREVVLGDFNITFVYGVRVSVHLSPADVTEGKTSRLVVRIESDCVDCIDSVNLNIVLPSGLAFKGGGTEVSEAVALSGAGFEKDYIITGLKPGEYVINISVDYVFNGVYKVVLGRDDIPSTKLVVRENLLVRYYIYFVVALVISLVVAYLVRRTG